MPTSLDDLFGLHARSLMLRAKRTELLASNLANVDTPNYKARDLDFTGILRDAEKHIHIKTASTHRRHLPLNAASTNSAPVKYRVPHQSSLDGNTVENDVEQGRFAENAVRYQASLKFLGDQANGLIRALKGE
ncbi:MAG TPA: flagellar basal body rod protein FlgB [Gammaproteobacteria bacterium]|nr:flagellar basal body rod protein FlgB [Gammaproteobacteria bacterium]